MLKRSVPFVRNHSSYLGNWRVKVDDRLGTCVKHNATALVPADEVHVWLKFSNGLVSEFKLSDIQRGEY